MDFLTIFDFICFLMAFFSSFSAFERLMAAAEKAQDDSHAELAEKWAQKDQLKAVREKKRAEAAGKGFFLKFCGNCGF